jgi:sec-independent protein translocase protein TatA
LVFSVIVMNIAGTEWFIIIFLFIILFFGSKNLPSFSRTIGRAIGEYHKVRSNLENEMLPTSNSLIGPAIVPVSSEREKLEVIAKSLGIDYPNLSDDSLRSMISRKLHEKNGISSTFIHGFSGGGGLHDLTLKYARIFQMI